MKRAAPALAITLAATFIPAASAAPTSLALPDTLTGQVSWQVPGTLVADAWPMGVITADQGNEGTVYALVRPDGSTAWTTPTVKASQAFWVGQGSGRPWLVTITGQEEAQISVFDGYGSGRLEAINTVTLAGAVRVAASHDALVLHTGGGAFVLDPLTGGPGTLLTAHEGVTYVAATGGAVLVQDDGGAGVWAPGGSWTGADHHPDGVEAASGEFLAWDGATVVTSWATKTGRVLAVQDLATGRILAQAPVGQDATCSSVVVDDEGAWAGCGTYVFDLTGGQGRQLDGDNQVVAIHDRVAYTLDAKGNAASAVDVRTGDPVGRTDFDVVPHAFTPNGAILTTDDQTLSVPTKKQ